MPEGGPPDFVRIAEFHREMRELLREFEAALEQPSSPESLNDVRMRVQASVFHYLNLVETQVYPWMLMRQQEAFADGARALIAEGGDFSNSLRKHVRTWTDDRAMDRWDDYRAASLDLVRRMLLRSERELVDLYSPFLPQEVKARPWLERLRNRVIERRAARVKNTPRRSNPAASQ